MTLPVNIADLVRLEDEIEAALLNLLDKPAAGATIAELKRRRMHLHDEIECLLHGADDADAVKPARPH